MKWLTRDRVVPIISEVIPWHSHSEIADHFFVLEGELTVETRAPDDYRTLGIASVTKSMQDTSTRLQIAEQEIVKFLIVQGVGRYDFLRSSL
jgi:hypothetical protein